MVEERKRIEQRRIVGQRSAIRRVNPMNRSDLDRLGVIDKSDGYIKWFNSIPEDYVPLTREGLTDLATTNDHVLYAVSGSVEDDRLSEKEKGRLQGWVKVKKDESSRVDQLIEQQLIINNPNQTILEISFAKLPDALNGQMASGVRQVCIEVAREDSDRFGTTDPSNIILVAYVIDDYRGTNENSLNVLTNSGFEEKGKVQYDIEALKPDRVFVLSWEKLDNILKNKAPIV